MAALFLVSGDIQRMKRRTCRLLVPALECLLKETKNKNYQDGKDKENDRGNPIASGRSVRVHGTIPLKPFVTLLTAIAQCVCHTDVTFR